MAAKHPINLLLLSLFLLPLASAQLECRGNLSTPPQIFSDVAVEGGVCTLDGVNITGSVFVSNGGELRTRGNVAISGGLNGAGHGPITLLGNVTVNGPLSVSDSTAPLTLVAGARVASIAGLNAANVAVYGGKVIGGGIGLRGGTGDIVLCGATVTGGIRQTDVTGGLRAVVAPRCSPSFLTGAIASEKGRGDISIVGNRLTAGDLLVVEQAGNIVVRNSTVSDISFNMINGSVLLDSIFADSDGSITGTTGSITVQRSSFQGDLIVAGNGVVTVRNNNFGFEVVTVARSSGGVTFSGNRDFSGVLTENSGLSFNENSGRIVTITKNTNAVAIGGNNVSSLLCADNEAPTGGENNVTLVATAECRALL